MAGGPIHRWAGFEIEVPVGGRQDFQNSYEHLIVKKR